MLFKVCHHKTCIQTTAGHLLQVNQRIIAECRTAIGRRFAYILILHGHTRILLVKMSPLVKEHGTVTVAVQYQCPFMQLFCPSVQSGLLRKPAEYGHHGTVILKQETLRMPLNSQDRTECG